MNLKLFSVRDSKVEAFLAPFTARTTAEALRMWSETVNSPDSSFAKHSEDFCLFELGEFDSGSGCLSVLPQPHSLGLAAQFVKPSN